MSFTNALIYYVKFTYLVIHMTVVSALFMPYFLHRPCNVLNFIPVVKCLGYASLVLGITFKIRGYENLRKNETCVFVSNHQSSLDLLGMFVMWPIVGKLTVVARMLLLFAGPFGLGAYLCGLVFINKDSRDRGKQTMLNVMDELKRERICLWVFPEGYRNHTGSIDEFKKGAFHTAVQAQVPIVPVVFSSYKTFMRKSDKFFGSGEIIIEALPAIPTEGLTSEDVNQLTAKTREIIINKYNELNSEIENKLKTN